LFEIINEQKKNEKWEREREREEKMKLKKTIWRERYGKMINPSGTKTHTHKHLDSLPPASICKTNPSVQTTSNNIFTIINARSAIIIKQHKKYIRKKKIINFKFQK
jgi:hypothetical protein